MAWTEKEQIECYGMTEEEMLKQYEFFPKFGDRDKLMYVMQILSDAQEEMALGDNETARQFINKAKYFTSDVWQNLPRL